MLNIVSTVYNEPSHYKYCVILNADGLDPHIFHTTAQRSIFHTRPLSTPHPPPPPIKTNTMENQSWQVFFSTSAAKSPFSPVSPSSHTVNTNQRLKHDPSTQYAPLMRAPRTFPIIFSPKSPLKGPILIKLSK